LHQSLTFIFLMQIFIRLISEVNFNFHKKKLRNYNVYVLSFIFIFLLGVLKKKIKQNIKFFLQQNKTKHDVKLKVEFWFL